MEKLNELIYNDDIWALEDNENEIISLLKPLSIIEINQHQDQVRFIKRKLREILTYT